MEKISVIDNFLTQEELKKVKDIIQSKSWSFYHTSNGRSDINTPFWSTELYDETYLSEYIKNIIEKHFFKKFTIIRLYANAQTFGQDGEYHIDDDADDCFTFVLYINNVKHYDIDLACGYIYFKLPELNYKICYEPIDNRGIMFPSNYTHKACAFTRFIKELRVVISFKLKELK